MTDKKIKIVNVVGARPNFMKIAPLYKAYKKNAEKLQPVLVHTNQHKDDNMSGTFFRSLGIPKPDYSLSVTRESPVGVISQIMLQLENVFEKEKPDLVLVVGDVNSTAAAAITANKMGIKIAYVESGLRSQDRSMPEEINRIVVDHISDMLFVTEKSGVENLKNEGVENSRIFLTGNVMIDNLIQTLPEIDKSEIIKKLGLAGKRYAVMTMHRPSNVDSKEKLLGMLSLLKKITSDEDVIVVFPIHPRTAQNIEKFKLTKEMGKIEKLLIVEPLDYIQFIKLAKESFFIMTDSGGIQEEAAYLKVPTITLRKSTERPSTIECGSNHLMDMENLNGINKKIKEIIRFKKSDIGDIPLNDGKASERILDIIVKNIKNDTV